MKLTVFPLPVARDIPRRLLPCSKLARTAWMHSSWYCRSWIFSGALGGGIAIWKGVLGDTYRRASGRGAEQAVHLLKTVNHPLDAGGIA